MKKAGKGIFACLAFLLIVLAGIAGSSGSVQAAESAFTENGHHYYDFGDGRVYDMDQNLLYRYKSSSKTYTLESYPEGSPINNLYAKKNVSYDVLDQYLAYYKSFDGNLVIADTIKGKKVTALGTKAFVISSSVKSVTLGKNITTIAKECFAYQKSIKQITLSNSVQTIGELAFSDSGITSIVIGKNVKKMGMSVFINCKSLEKVTIAKGKLKALPECCFLNCSSLKELVVPSNVTSLGESVFEGCTKLEKVTLQGKIKTIPERCFTGCKALKEYKIPSSVKTIGTDAFFRSGLTSIYIPSNVKTLGYGVFADCKSLVRAEFAGKVKKCQDDLFQRCNQARLTVIAPKNSYVYNEIKYGNLNHGSTYEKVMLTSSKKFGFNIRTNLMVVGEKKRIAAMNAQGNLKWKSSSPSVLQITRSGVATAKKAGTATLTATDGTRKYTITMKVLARTMDNVMKVITNEYVRPEMSDYEKVWEACRWLQENVKYDNETNRAAKGYKGGKGDSYTGRGAFLNGLAVCSGYASAFSTIMSYYKIPCTSVASFEMNHVWNAVEIDGKWYYIDTTWDDYFFNDKEPNAHTGYSFSKKTYSRDTINTKIRTKSENSSKKAENLKVEPYLNAVKLTMAKGGNKFTLKLSGAKVKSYRSKQSGIVSVSKRGVLTPNKKGTTSILVKASNGKTYTCVVKVEDPAINYSKRMLNKGESVNLKINGTSQKVVWSSSDPKVAVVSSKGKVTAVGMGSAKITTTVNGRKFSCMITVHTHSYSKQVVKTATCTTDGSIKYTCACGANYTEKIKASGHNYQWSVGKKPSVTPAKTVDDFGTRSLMCTNCKDVKRTENIMNINGKLVYGYFDDAKALMLRGEINKQRAENGYSETIRQPLPAGAALESAAKLRAVEYALAQYGSGNLAGVRVISETDYMGAAYEHEESAVNAADRMCNDRSTENIFFGTEAESIGTACFYYAHNGAASTGESSGYSSYWIALLK